MKVCAIVVWYNPNHNMWKNVEKYLPSVDKCIIVDNSDKDKSNLIKSKNKKIVYVSNKENLGIAKALNQGCEFAKKLGFEWVLTMDQDSYFNEENIRKYFKDAEKIYKNNKQIISFTPNYPGNFHSENFLNECITAGNLLKITGWEKVKGFHEKYFIYWVDTSFCYDLIKKGYKIFNLKNARMKYNIFDNDTININLFRRHWIIRKDNTPLMKYYFVRNGLDILKKYPKYEKNQFFSLKVIIKFILFENKKMEKLKMTIKGYKDYKKGKFGKYEK